MNMTTLYQQAWTNSLALFLNGFELLKGNAQHFREAKVSHWSWRYARQLLSNIFALSEMPEALRLELGDRDRLADSCKSHCLGLCVPRAEFLYALQLLAVTIVSIFMLDVWFHDRVSTIYGVTWAMLLTFCTLTLWPWVVTFHVLLRSDSLRFLAFVSIMADDWGKFQSLIRCVCVCVHVCVCVWDYLNSAHFFPHRWWWFWSWCWVPERRWWMGRRGWGTWYWGGSYFNSIPDIKVKNDEGDIFYSHVPDFHSPCPCSFQFLWITLSLIWYEPPYVYVANTVILIRII